MSIWRVERPYAELTAWHLEGDVIEDRDVAIEVVEDAVWLTTERGGLQVRIPLADIAAALLRGAGWIDPA